VLETEDRVVLTHKQGDMFTTDAYVIGHGTNCKGVMGAGVAAIVRENFPTVYEQYKKQYEAGELIPGDASGFLTVRPGTDRGIWVFNLNAQDEPGPNAKLELVVESMRHMLDAVEDMGSPKVAIPRIGCGIGSLSWEKEVYPALWVLSLAYPSIEIEVWYL